MPREKDFDQNEVLQKCILLFSKKGYSATGIRDIVKSTGLNRSSLYATFKGKDELFHSCLHKAASEELLTLNKMKEKSSGIKFIDDYFYHLSSDHAVHHLFKFASAEYRMLSKKSQKYINAHYKDKHEIILQVIKDGQKKDVFHQKTEAKHLVAIIDLLGHGLQNLSHSSETIYKRSVKEFSNLIKKKSK